MPLVASSLYQIECNASTCTWDDFTGKRLGQRRIIFFLTIILFDVLCTVISLHTPTVQQWARIPRKRTHISPVLPCGTIVCADVVDSKPPRQEIMVMESWRYVLSSTQTIIVRIIASNFLLSSLIYFSTHLLTANVLLPSLEVHAHFLNFQQPW